MHINYFLKELEILNKRIFFSRKQNIMFLTTPKCGSQFTKLFCLLNLTDPTGQGRPNDFFNSNNPELRQFFPNEKLSINQPVIVSEIHNVVEQYFREWGNDNTVTIEDLNNSNIKKYQIVRDPYKRLISFVSSNLDKPENIGKKEDKLFTEQYLLRSIIKYIKEPHKNTLEFSGKINNGYSSLYEHLFPQHDWLFSKYFQPIKLADLDEFLKDSPNYVIPEKQNFNHHTKYIFESKLDQETKDQIYELFRDDFVNFNYEK